MRKTGLALLCATLWLLAGLVQAGGGKDDVKKLQGKWVGAGPEGDTITFEVTKKNFTFSFGDKGTFKGTVKTDASKTPHEIDLTITEGPKEDYKGKTSLGIWEFDGDNLKWSGSEPGKTTRPASFDAKEKAHLNVVFKRAK